MFFCSSALRSTSTLIAPLLDSTPASNLTIYPDPRRSQNARMPYKPNQLLHIRFLRGATWFSWKELVGNYKTFHDQHGEGYPLRVQLKEAKGRLLLKQEWANVWDRKSKPQIMTFADWDLPVKFCTPRDNCVEHYDSSTVKIPVVDNSNNRQPLITELLEEHEKAARKS